MPSRRAIAQVTCLLLMLLAALWAYVASVHHDGTPWLDEVTYHRPAIEQFRAQFPHFDFRDYPVAMTPGYHVILATLAQTFGHAEAVLRGANIAWSLAVVALLVAILSRRLGWMSLVLTIPLLLSPYFNYAAIWLRPDNSAWLVVLAILAACLGGPMRGQRLLWASTLLCGLVFLRHAHIWCAAIIWAAAFADPSRDLSTRLKNTALAIGATAPAFAILYYFVRLWGGLVPPRFRTVDGAVPGDHSGWQHVGPNWSVPVIVIGLFGVLSVVYLPFVWSHFRRAWREHRMGMILGGIAAALVCTIPPSSMTPLIPNTVGARYSGLWNIAGRFPTFHDRSPFMIATCLLGGAMVMAWIHMLTPRWRWIMGMALAAFLSAQIANAEAWQKYYEPYLLIWLPLAVMGSLAGEPESRKPSGIPVDTVIDVPHSPAR